MDLKGKGITWVGNIYHRFEAIRSEVEDMSKETAKYVENQVQGVGVNVKKICAGVMHDFIPSSSVDPVKEEGLDMSVQKITDLGICSKESMTALDDNPINESVPHKVPEITADTVKGSTPVSFSTGAPDKNHLLPPPPVNPVKDVGLDCSLEQNDDNEDILTMENIETSKIVETTLPMAEDSRRASFSEGVYDINDLFPSSFASPVKDAGPEFLLEQNDDILTMENIETNKIVETTLPMVEDSRRASFSEGVYDINDLFPSFSASPVKDAGPEFLLEQNDDNEDILTMENIETGKIVETTVPMVEDSRRASFSEGVYDINDLFPSFSASPVKDAGPEFLLEQNDDNEDILTMENIETGKIVETTIPMVEDSRRASFSEGVYDINDLFPSFSASPVKDAGPEFLLEQNDDFDKHNKSKTAIEKDDVKVHPPQVGVSEVTDPAVEVQSPVFGTQTEMSPQTSVDVMIETFCQNGGDSHKKTLDQTGHVNDSSTAPSSSMFAPSLSCENQVVETGSAPPNSFPAEPNGMGTLIIEASKNECEQYKEPEAVKSPAAIGIQGRYGDSTVELDDGDEALDMDKETIDKFDNVELEDSCILVLSKEFFAVPSRKSHHRSYKKKIQDAFASRMRTGKKKEYELLAMWYADIDAGADQQRLENAIPCTLSRTLDSKSLPIDDSCGSDWEIL